MVNPGQQGQSYLKIAELRRQVGMSQIELAEKVGVSKATLARWESENGELWIEQIVLLCEMLNCSLQELATKELANLRQKKNLTRRKLAKSVGVSEGTFAAWEKPRSVLQRRVKMIIKLCEALYYGDQGCLPPWLPPEVLEPSLPVSASPPPSPSIPPRLLTYGELDRHEDHPMLYPSGDWGADRKADHSICRQGSDRASQVKEKLLEVKLYSKKFIREGHTHPSDNSKDLIDCSVFSPPSAPLNENFLVQVFVHLPEQADFAEQMAWRADSEAQIRGTKTLGVEIQRDSELTFDLSIPGLLIDSPVQSLIWRGKAVSVEFGITTPAALPYKTIIATVNVSQSAIPIGCLKFKLSIVDSEPFNGNPQPAGKAARLYQKAFVSYSSRDRVEVLKRVQALLAAGVDIFQDILSLEPGDRWEQKLYQQIGTADLFLLFWSTAAKESEWVIKEVLYALKCQRGDALNPPEIIPVLIEGPPPVSPPPELRHLHFNDHVLYLMAASS